ncbi:MAG: glycosyltransferase [Nanoarchaeota archaeon]|nr:glycosyltransferase [Nanoarchaeota archaeon]
MELSVIIPAHNEEKCIAETLDAIPNDVETIVICNGCTDNTFEIANSAKKPNIKVFNIPEKGVSKARNFGARLAKNEKIVFMDADIVPEGSVMQDISICLSNIGTCLVKPDVDKLVPKALMKIKSVAHSFGTCTGLIFCTRDIFDRVGGFDESLEIGEDGKFLRQAKKLGEYTVVKGYVINSMRRFEQKGYFYICWFWVKNFVYPTKKKYEVIR